MSSVTDLISIIMPFKNEQAYIEECLDSILSQSIDNWELLAIDDNSTDQSASIIDRYVSKDKRVKYLSNHGAGIIEALRTGYTESQGTYITRMDADDIMSNNKLDNLYNCLKLSGDGYLATGQVKYFSDDGVGDGYLSYQNWLNDLTITGGNYRDIYKECVIPSPCWMVSRYDFDKCSGFELDVYPEDYDLCFRFYQGGLKVIPNDKILHHWRDYPSRSSRTDPNYSDNRFLKLKYDYFFRLDRDHSRPLVIWGAGKKGKALAKYLIGDERSFNWVCNNPNKVGKDIYGKVLEPQSSISAYSDSQILLCVANKTEQSEIRTYIDSEGLSTDLYAFC